MRWARRSSRRASRRCARPARRRPFCGRRRGPLPAARRPQRGTAARRGLQCAGLEYGTGELLAALGRATEVVASAAVRVGLPRVAELGGCVADEHMRERDDGRRRARVVGGACVCAMMDEVRSRGTVTRAAAALAHRAPLRVGRRRCGSRARRAGGAAGVAVCGT